MAGKKGVSQRLRSPPATESQHGRSYQLCGLHSWCDWGTIRVEGWELHYHVSATSDSSTAVGLLVHQDGCQVCQAFGLSMRLWVIGFWMTCWDVPTKEKKHPINWDYSRRSMLNMLLLAAGWLSFINSTWIRNNVGENILANLIGSCDLIWFYRISPTT